MYLRAQVLKWDWYYYQCVVTYYIYRSVHRGITVELVYNEREYSEHSSIMNPIFTHLAVLLKHFYITNAVIPNTQL